MVAWFVASVILAPVALGLVTSPVIASASPVTPKSAILSSIGPGWTVSAPGPFNGPLGTSALAPLFNTAGGQVKRLLNSGEVTGYLRRWTEGSPVRAGVVILITEFPDTVSAQACQSGENHSAEQTYKPLHSVVPGTNLFSSTTERGNVTENISVVTMSRGRFCGAVTGAAIDEPMISATLLAIGAVQINRFPYAPPPSNPYEFDYRLGEISAPFLAALAVFVLVMVSRHRARLTGRGRWVTFPAAEGEVTPPANHPDVHRWPTAASRVSVAGETDSSPPSAPVWAPRPPIVPAADHTPADTTDATRSQLAPEGERPTAPPDPRTSFWDE